jgi:hypothetical protein
MIVDNHFTRQYIPEDNSEHHTRRRENLKSQVVFNFIGIKATQGGIATSCEFTGFHVQSKDSKKKVKLNLCSLLMKLLYRIYRLSHFSQAKHFDL